MTVVRNIVRVVGWGLLVVGPIYAVVALVLAFATGSGLAVWDRLVSFANALPASIICAGLGAAFLLVADLHRRLTVNSGS